VTAEQDTPGLAKIAGCDFTCHHVFMKLRKDIYADSQDYVCASCGLVISSAEKLLFDTGTEVRH
jgi:transcription initiation factor TFIIIB Brf1 subunit/transcription initiation factor TFIIB